MTTAVEYRIKLNSLQAKLEGDLHFKKRSRLEADYRLQMKHYNRLLPRDGHYREWYRDYHLLIQERERGHYGPP